MESADRVAKRFAVLSSHLYSNESPCPTVFSAFELEHCQGMTYSAVNHGRRYDGRSLFGRPSSEDGPLFWRCSSASVEQVQEADMSKTCVCKDVNASPPAVQKPSFPDIQFEHGNTPPMFAKPVGQRLCNCCAKSNCSGNSSGPGCQNTVNNGDSRPLFARPTSTSLFLPVKEPETVRVPQMDVVESSTVYHVTADLPGVNPKSVRVEISGKKLVVLGKRSNKSSAGEKIYLRKERTTGPYRADWDLPDDALANGKGVKAHIRDGVLYVSLPKHPRTLVI